MGDLKLTEDGVKGLWQHCLNKPGDKSETVTVQSAVNEGAFVLNKGRLQGNRAVIRDYLARLPEKFRREPHGWSLLDAVTAQDGTRWTNDPTMADKLIMLGVAVGLAEFRGAREKWRMEPGGMPLVLLRL